MVANDVTATMMTGLPVVHHEKVWTAAAIQRLVTLSVLIAVTLAGNISIVSALTCCRRSARYRTINRRAVNVFIVNLAIGDLTVCCFTMTTEVVFVVHDNDWVLGDVACRLIVYVQIVTLASTTFILTAMSIDRYLVVYCPLSNSKSRAAKMITVAWIVSFVVAVPQIFIFRQNAVGVYRLKADYNTTSSTHNSVDIKYECASRGYTAWWQRKTYFTAMSTYIFVVPTLIISFCYFKIVRAVWRQGNRLDVIQNYQQAQQQQQQQQNPESPAAGTKIISSIGSAQMRQQQEVTPGTSRLELAPTSDHDVIGGVAMQTAKRLTCNVAASRRILLPLTERREQAGDDVIVPQPSLQSNNGAISTRAKIQTLKMTLSIVGLFIICWTPYFVVHLVHIWSEYRLPIPAFVFAFSDTVALVNSAVNPVLYAVFTVRPFGSSSSGRQQCAVGGGRQDDDVRVQRQPKRPTGQRQLKSPQRLLRARQTNKRINKDMTPRAPGLLQAGVMFRTARTAPSRRHVL